jgi:20S proteasome alpha/beta subunit
MTMQVGMVGTDGILIASDKIWTLPGARVTQTVTKLKYSGERGIGVGCAEAEMSVNIANRIIECLPDGNHEAPSYLLEQYAKEIMSGFDTPMYRRWGGPLQSQCLVALNRPFGLYSLKVGPEGVKCERIEDKTRVGDTDNSAIFFLESFYSLRRVEQLKLLAAHIVLEAARRNPVGVGGLEMLIVDGEGAKMVPQDELSKLTERSNALHDTIRNAL